MSVPSFGFHFLSSSRPCFLHCERSLSGFVEFKNTSKRVLELCGYIDRALTDGELKLLDSQKRVSLWLFFTKTRVVKLRLRSLLSGTANSFTRMPKFSTCCLLTPYPCIMCTYPILSSLFSPAPPRHEYILNGTWRSH